MCGNGTRPRKWGPELHKGPNWQCCRAQRRLYSTGLSACPRSRGYSRPNGGWREIFAGVRKIAPIGASMGRSKAHCGGRISYTPILCQRPRCSYAVLTGGKCANGTGSSKHYGSWHIDQRLGAGSRQTFCNGPHWDYRPINGDRGLDVWMLQNFIRSLRGGIDALPKMHEARLLMECINMSRRYKETPQFRLETLSNRLVGEIEEGYSTYVALSNIPAQFTGSFVFQALYGDGQIRLRSSIRPSEPAYATAAGGGAFTLSGPGVSSACGGIVFERTNRTVFVAHIAPERANEVVYNPWIGCTGVVREAYQFVASQDSRTSAVIPHPANDSGMIKIQCWIGGYGGCLSQWSAGGR